LEYELVLPDTQEFIDRKDKDLSESYGRLVILTEGEWNQLSETLRSMNKQIRDLEYLLELEQDDASED
jgi:hypothetical protein